MMWRGTQVKSISMFLYCEYFRMFYSISNFANVLMWNDSEQYILISHGSNSHNYQMDSYCMYIDFNDI